MILLFIGMIITVITEFNYVTEQNIESVGSLEIIQENDHPVKWPLIIGGTLIITAVLVFINNSRKRV